MAFAQPSQEGKEGRGKVRQLEALREKVHSTRRAGTRSDDVRLQVRADVDGQRVGGASTNNTVTLALPSFVLPSFPITSPPSPDPRRCNSSGSGAPDATVPGYLKVRYLPPY